jgi:hypothetical protein
MPEPGSVTRRALRRVGSVVSALALASVLPAIPLATAASTAAPASTAASSVTLYASPSGSGSTCSASAPCSLSGAQSAVRTRESANSGANVSVLLADGTYRLASTWTFSAADSGTPGHPVVWEAAPGAHPVISGASQIIGWTQVGSNGVWSAPVPAGSNSRQLYVNGQEAPVAQASPASLGFAGSWTGSSTGYTISADPAAAAWFGSLTASQVAGAEFDYPGGNGAWTESRCRVASYSATAETLTMTEPCWTDVTDRSSFAQGSGGLPSMSTSQMPALIEDAQSLLGTGQWFLNAAGSTLYYKPLAGQQMTSLDVELPHLESLVQGAGTLAAPLHDITLSFHNYLEVRSDGGAIYAEGHQAEYIYESNGTTVNPTQTLANGLQATGNIAYNGQSADFTYYDDAGSEWINWQGNVAFGAGANSQGGCSPTGHFWITGNYFSAGTQSYPCAQPVDSNASGNTSIPATPGPTSIPTALLTAAGAGSGSYPPVLSVNPIIYYVSPTTSATQVLVAGEGFNSTTAVYIGSTQVTDVTHLSSGFMIVPIPAGTTAGQISVTSQAPGVDRINDTDSSISYSGFSYSANRGFGDYEDDLHYATANGSTASLTFTGTGIAVYGEQYTDQGNIGISIDGGAQQVVSTVSSDGTRHANVAVYTSGTLAAGTHTVVVTKLSGEYTTLDGFAILGG